MFFESKGSKKSAPSETLWTYFDIKVSDRDHKVSYLVRPYLDITNLDSKLTSFYILFLFSVLRDFCSSPSENDLRYIIYLIEYLQTDWIAKQWPASIYRAKYFFDRELANAVQGITTSLKKQQQSLWHLPNNVMLFNTSLDNASWQDCLRQVGTCLVLYDMNWQDCLRQV